MAQVQPMLAAAQPGLFPDSSRESFAVYLNTALHARISADSSLARYSIYPACQSCTRICVEPRLCHGCCEQEAAWALSNATSGGTQEQIKYLVNIGCIKPLCDLLPCSDVRIVTVALEGLENILKVGRPLCAHMCPTTPSDYNLRLAALGVQPACTCSS